MKNLSLLHILFLSFIFAGNLYAQYDETHYWKQLSSSRSIPSNRIQTVFQDKSGYIWIGTENLLYRYDGYNYKYFSLSANNTTLTDNLISCITEDDNGIIWIGTDNGLLYLNKRDYKIRQTGFDPLKKNRINSLLNDCSGGVLIGTKDGLFRYDTSLSEYAYCSGNVDLPSGGVNHIYADKKGDIWVCFWDKGLYKYTDKTKKYIPFPTIGSRNNPFRIFQDDHMNYWIATWGDGLFRFYPDNKPEQMYESFIMKKTTSNDDEKIFYSIEQDNKFGYIWLATYSGIKALSFNNGKYTSISSLFLNTTTNLFNEIKKDNQGNLWLGTYGDGIYNICIDYSKSKVYKYKDFTRKYQIIPSINAIYQDKDSIWWISFKRQGLLCLNTKEELVLTKECKKISEQLNAGDVNIIQAMKENEEVWLSSDNDYRIFAYKKEDGSIKFKHEINLNIFPPVVRGIRCFYEDGYGKVWIGTQQGVFLYDYANEKTTQVKEISFPVTNITGNQHDIWISTENNGIVRFSLADKKVINYNAHNNKVITNQISTIYCAQSGVLYAGTYEGDILSFDSTLDNFTIFHPTKWSIPEVILNIIDDSSGNLFFSTPKRIFRINPRDNSISTISEGNNESVAPYNKDAIFKDKSGGIYFSGNKGTLYFPPNESDQISSHESQLNITDILIQNQSILNTKYADHWDTKKNKITLEADQKSIQINFSALNYFFSDNTFYAYKLVGVDQDWIYVGGERNFVQYNNLGKGEYSFLIKSTDESGKWTEKPLVLQIIRKPHWSETWWAYCIYSLLFITFVFFLFYFFLNRININNELRLVQIEKDNAEQLNQTKLKYFTNISHELLTPLTILLCLISDVEKNVHQRLPQLSMMRHNVDRLKRLILQILDFRKIENESLTLHLEKADIIPFLKSICYDNYTPLIKEKNINFQFISSADSISLFFDRDKVDKIFFNLLSNAFKYTDQNGTVVVQVQETCNLNNNKMLQIAVSDTGKGIAPEEIDRIFNRFYRNPENKLVESNGIGLSLSKELVKIHKGKIFVESQVNIGTTFIIELPLDEFTYTQEELRNVDRQKQQIILNEESSEFFDSESLDIKENIIILLVEDNTELRSLMQRILERYYKVISVNNGKQALSIIDMSDIDIIISDVMMPEMDGLELCRTIKKDINSSHIPVLMVTAKNQAEDRIECYNAGADGYISKPFEQSVLEAKLRNLTRIKRKTQQDFKENIFTDLTILTNSEIDQNFLKRVVDLIQNEQTKDLEDFDINFLAEKMNMSRSSFYRKIKLLTNLSPIDFINNIRMKQACELLSDPNNSIKDVSYAVGFADQRYFSSCFKKEFGMTPTEFQKRKNSK